MDFTIDEELLKVFYEEVEEQTSDLESSLMELEQDSENIELINKIFRILHTIKGSCALVGLEKISNFIHKIETVYSSIRDGKFKVKKELINYTLTANDYIKALIDDIEKVSNKELKELLEKIYALYDLKLEIKKEKTKDEDKNKDIEENKENKENKVENKKSKFKIVLKPKEDFYVKGGDILSIINDLNNLGEITVNCIIDNIPNFDSLVPDQCYLSWEIIIKTDKSIDDIKNILLFLENDEFEILRDFKTEKKSLPKINKEPIHSLKDSNLKVPHFKLDRLLDLVGELVLAQTRLSMLSEKYNYTELSDISEHLENLITELRDITLDIRMVQIGNFFGKFKRIVRDISNEQGKKVDFITEGGDTELDKAVIDAMMNPLIHILRNSIDHGIELPEERKQKNKLETGKIILKAEHTGGYITITISDDGRGINLEKVKQKAIDLGLIKENSHVSTKEIMNFIFYPGLSTVDKVSSLSGRGVGMDVVKRDLKKVGGDIVIKSEIDKGTEIKIMLPLTLAIIEGIMVRVKDSYFVIPGEFVKECIEYIPNINNENSKGKLLEIRGKLVPFVRLREYFKISSEVPEIEEVVLVNIDKELLGFAVDKIIGQKQIVIKNFGPLLSKLKCFSGATIRGDGSIALILDIITLFNEIKK